MNKERILEKFFTLNQEEGFDDEYRPNEGILIEYEGEHVDSVDVNPEDSSMKLYTNQDRECSWPWDEVNVKYFSAYRLTKIDLEAA